VAVMARQQHFGVVALPVVREHCETHRPADASSAASRNVISRCTPVSISGCQRSAAGRRTGHRPLGTPGASARAIPEHFEVDIGPLFCSALSVLARPSRDAVSISPLATIRS
jgi:hypothetical protein